MLLVAVGPAPALAQVAPSRDEVALYLGLHAAAASGDMSALERLLAEGADRNARDRRGRTALMVAAYRRNRTFTRALLEAGADVNALDHDRYDVLTIAAVLDDPALVRLAIEFGADAAQITSPYRGTALIAAAHLGHAEVVRALTEAKAPLDHVNNLGWTALIEAIVLGDGGARHQATVRVLIEAGANVDLGDGAGTRPLSLARNRGFQEIAKLLEAAGARP